VHSSLYCFIHSKCSVSCFLLDDALQPATPFIDEQSINHCEFAPVSDDHVPELLAAGRTPSVECHPKQLNHFCPSYLMPHDRRLNERDTLTSHVGQGVVSRV